MNLSRLEDPEFTIKDALIVTGCPGASAAEVADEVTDVIERAVQQMGPLDRVTSRSERGRSTVTATIKAQYESSTLPQVWNELRNRVGDAQRQLPPGATASLVLDDFGDVFGIFYAITGEDCSQTELYDVAKMLRQNLVLVNNVNKVEIFADQQEIIYVEMARNMVSQLGIRPRGIAAALGEQNLVRFPGIADSGPLRITIDPTGSSQSVELNAVAFQADNISEAINNFVESLAQAVGIVFIILLVFMGLRSGLIIGAVLFITICGTMIVMDVLELSLERISLGALIIALGMLVDSAIVTTEGMRVAIQRGVDRMKGAKDIVSQTAVPLLGSTAIAILAFGAIGLSDDSTGEYCRSLFTVLLVALGICWLNAVTTTPLFCYLFLNGKPAAVAGAPEVPEKDPYGGFC